MPAARRAVSDSPLGGGPAALPRDAAAAAAAVGRAEEPHVHRDAGADTGRQEDPAVKVAGKPLPDRTRMSRPCS